MPFDLASLVGGFLPFMLGGEFRLGRDLGPPPFIMAGEGGVCDLGGLFLGAVGTFDFAAVEEDCEIWRREDDSRRGRMNG